MSNTPDNSKPDEILELKRIRNYFGNNDKSQFGHWAYHYLDVFIKKMSKEMEPNSTHTPHKEGGNYEQEISVEARKWEFASTHMNADVKSFASGARYFRDTIHLPAMKEKDKEVKNSYNIGHNDCKREMNQNVISVLYKRNSEQTNEILRHKDEIERLGKMLGKIKGYLESNLTPTRPQMIKEIAEALTPILNPKD